MNQRMTPFEQAIAGIDGQFTGYQEINLWVRLSSFDVIAGRDKAESILQGQDIQDPRSLEAIRHRRQANLALRPARLLEQGHVMGPLVPPDYLRIGQQIFVDCQPHLDIRLPGSFDAELIHTRLGFFNQVKALHQKLGHFPARPADNVLESLDDLLFPQSVRAEFNGSLGIGQRLQFLRLDQRPVQVKDHGSNHLLLHSDRSPLSPQGGVYHVLHAAYHPVRPPSY